MKKRSSSKRANISGNKTTYSCSPSSRTSVIVSVNPQAPFGRQRLRTFAAFGDASGKADYGDASGKADYSDASGKAAFGHV